jgi:hypothetical protein
MLHTDTNWRPKRVLPLVSRVRFPWCGASVQSNLMLFFSTCAWGMSRDPDADRPPSPRVALSKRGV